MAAPERRVALGVLGALTLLWGAMMLQFGAREIYWLVGGYALITSALLLWVFGRELRGLLRARLRDAAIGLAVGAAMTLATYPVYRLAVAWLPWLERHVTGLYRTSHEEQLLTALAWVLVISFAEELLFRGAWLLALERRLGKRGASAVSIALYSVAQVCTGSLIVGLLALCCGAVWTIERQLTRSLVPSILSHMIWTPTVILLCPVVE
jgi:membrane protease YdiL (CAAX protease family)